MTTLNDLIVSVSAALHSYTGLHEQTTWLTSGIDADDLIVQVASSDAVMKGIAEIGEELVYVDVSDSGALSLAPFGRGYRGSTAASHAANDQLIYDPAFPKVEVKKAILQCVAGLHPDLFQIKSTDLTYSPEPIGYELPADTDKVLEVKTKVDNDPVNFWEPIYYWNFDPKSPEATGKVINIMQTLRPSADIRVVYAAPFGVFASNDATLTSIGVPESCADLITYCVTARLIRFMDPARLQTVAVENLGRSNVVQVGDAGKVANQLYAMYQQRLLEERNKLLELTPARINFTR